MATLTIRNLPEELHLALKERARKNRRSLNQEVILGLDAAAGRTETETAVERWQRANAMVDEMRARMTRLMTEAEIDASIREGGR